MSGLCRSCRLVAQVHGLRTGALPMVIIAGFLSTTSNSTLPIPGSASRGAFRAMRGRNVTRTMGTVVMLRQAKRDRSHSNGSRESRSDHDSVFCAVGVWMVQNIAHQWGLCVANRRRQLGGHAFDRSQLPIRVHACAEQHLGQPGGGCGKCPSISGCQGVILRMSSMARCVAYSFRQRDIVLSQ